MPSSHPIPSLPALSLSFMLTVKKYDRLPHSVIVQPWERACFVVTLDNGLTEEI